MPSVRRLSHFIFLSRCVLASPSIKDALVTPFFSRPELSVPILDIHTHDIDLVDPGYLFIATWTTQSVDPGPYIYDMAGELVWAGTFSFTGEMAQNVHVCEYQSAPHICFFEGRSERSWGFGREVILDSSYKRVHTVEPPGSANDMHEFNMVDGGRSALVTSYTVDPNDLSSANMSEGLAFVLNGRFREVDVATSEVKFEWSSLDHINPIHSQEPIGRNVLRRAAPFDFIHLNSVDKFSDGNYLISARHSDCIYKISAETGSILWRLGGPHSDFEMDFSMARQHHARILTHSSSRNETTMSFFNNGLETTHSSGMIVRLDEKNWRATLEKEFLPQGHMFVPSQGSMVVSTSGNALVNWGQRGTVSEHLPDGRIIWNATIAAQEVPTYRAFKAEWKGFPAEKPRIWAYAKTKERNSVVHCSWNGATEVAYWRIHGRDADGDGEPLGLFSLVSETRRTGFETACVADKHVSYAFAEAIAKDGTSLGNSSVQRTFVPSPQLSHYCTDYSCPMQAGNTSRPSDLQVEEERRLTQEARARQRNRESFFRFCKESCAWFLSLCGVAAICQKLIMLRRPAWWNSPGSGYKSLSKEEH